jgi:hypothetical protein
VRYQPAKERKKIGDIANVIKVKANCLKPATGYLKAEANL